MVTPIQPGSFPVQTQPTQPTAESRGSRIDRSLSEAKRLLNEHHITGAKAMRISALIESAEHSAGSGNTAEAERMAREALNVTREIADESGKRDTTSLSRNNDNIGQSAAADKEGSAFDEPLPTERETTHFQDGSEDQGISFQFAQPLTQAQAPFAVRQHELSHVRRDTSDAILNGQRVMTSVRIFSRIDPHTGERHVEGGNTRIVIFPNIEHPAPASPVPERGSRLDTQA